MDLDELGWTKMNWDGLIISPDFFGPFIALGG